MPPANDEMVRDIDPPSEATARHRGVVLAALLLVAGFSVALLGALVLAGAFTDLTALGVGGLGLGVLVVFVGAIKLTRGLRSQ
jgi:hypothetical protein